MSTEIELKLGLAPNQAQRLRANPLLGGIRPVRRRLFSRYFDTPDGRLHGHGAALRVRKIGRRWVQTLKCGGESRAGLWLRPEWETPLRGPSPEPGQFPAEALEPLGVPEDAELIPVFETDFWRTTWSIPVGDGGAVELCLDQGGIQAGQRQQPLCEIELELKGGERADCYRLALSLLEDLDLTIAPASKAERGRILLTGTLPPPVKAGMSPVSSGMRVEEAFVAVLWSTLAQLIGNLDGLSAGEDPEYLHQARVAVRRMRAALNFFEPALPEDALAWLNGELRWLGGGLGPARDWDVFVTETLPAMRAGLFDCREFAALETAARRHRLGLLAHARRVAADVRLTRLVVRLGLWLETREWRHSANDGWRNTLDAPLRTFADRRLADRHLRLLRRGKNLSRLSESQRHRLRIAAKKMRYGAEFMTALYSEKQVRPFVRALSELQDVLGGLNDLRTARELAGELARSRRGCAISLAAGLVAGYGAKDTQDRLAGLERQWRKFKGHKPFWRNTGM